MADEHLPPEEIELQEGSHLEKMFDLDLDSCGGSSGSWASLGMFGLSTNSVSRKPDTNEGWTTYVRQLGNVLPQDNST